MPRPFFGSGQGARIVCMGVVAFALMGLGLGLAARFYLPLDVFAQFRLQLILVAIGFGIGSFMPRKRFSIGLAMSLLGFVAIGLYPQFVSSKISPASPENGLSAKVMSFNMSIDNRKPELVLEEVRQQDPDILVLIEMSEKQKGLRQDLEKLYPFVSDCDIPRACYVSIFSRFAFEKPSIKKSSRLPQLAAVQFGRELGGLFFMGVHTLRFPHGHTQMLQYRALAALLKQQSHPQIVMGDFNATPYSAALAEFEASSQLSRETYLPSWPSYVGLPQLAIDHIFVSKGVTIMDQARIGASAGSDHYPIGARILISP